MCYYNGVMRKGVSISNSAKTSAVWSGKMKKILYKKTSNLAYYTINPHLGRDHKLLCILGNTRESKNSNNNNGTTTTCNKRNIERHIDMFTYTQTHTHTHTHASSEICSIEKMFDLKK
ncbi:unnamed protein product [Ceratitis capitata]|uniref:(Mediterranean fruit fly) hypothetical protein n=1 Tax=Ceratitis capitata TaxID=7213 RepID=A0A811UM11_CERCA|nr:unnamed protein product [Ceratitis capitata]